MFNESCLSPTATYLLLTIRRYGPWTTDELKEDLIDVAARAKEIDPHALQSDLSLLEGLKLIRYTMGSWVLIPVVPEPVKVEKREFQKALW